MPRDNAARAPDVIRLPTIREEGTPGAGLVRRAVRLTFVGLAGIFAGAILLAALLHIDVTVAGSGIAEPSAIWPVRAREAGVVQQVLVATGDSVDAGEPLVLLDTLEVSSTVAQLRSGVAEGELEYRRSVANQTIERQQLIERRNQAEATVIRTRALLTQRLADFGLHGDVDSVLQAYRPGTHAALDVAVADVLTAQAERRAITGPDERAHLDDLELAKQRAELERLRFQLTMTAARRERLVVRAPAAGIVLTERIELLVGSAVAEGAQLLEVADPGTWRATLYVNERDVRKVAVGDAVKIEVQAFARDRDLLRGHVTFVAEEPVAAGPSAGGLAGLYRVMTAIDAASLGAGQHELRRGYTVRGKIISKSGRIVSLLWQYVMER